jgi:hypothetical protein
VGGWCWEALGKISVRSCSDVRKGGEIAVARGKVRHGLAWSCQTRLEEEGV